jgi:hypothetical protein
MGCPQRQVGAALLGAHSPSGQEQKGKIGGAFEGGRHLVRAQRRDLIPLLVVATLLFFPPNPSIILFAIRIEWLRAYQFSTLLYQSPATWQTKVRHAIAPRPSSGRGRYDRLRTISSSWRPNFPASGSSLLSAMAPNGGKRFRESSGT